MLTVWLWWKQTEDGVLGKKKSYKEKRTVAFAVCFHWRALNKLFHLNNNDKKSLVLRPCAIRFNRFWLVRVFRVVLEKNRFWFSWFGWWTFSTALEPDWNGWKIACVIMSRDCSSVRTIHRSNCVSNEPYQPETAYRLRLKRSIPVEHDLRHVIYISSL